MNQLKKGTIKGVFFLNQEKIINNI